MGNKNIHRGFSLVELLVTLVIVAIVLSVAAPNFSDLMNRKGAEAAPQKLSDTLGSARSRAVSDNRLVFVCKGSGTSCSSSGHWEDGWVVYVDNNNNNTLNDGEAVHIEGPLRTGFTLRSPLNWLAFDGEGGVTNSNGSSDSVTFKLCPPSADIQQAWELTINPVGHIKKSQGTSVCP